MDSYELDYSPGLETQTSARALFIRRTYAHLAGAIVAFVGVEYVLLNAIRPEQVSQTLGGSPFAAIALLVAFMASSWVAQYWARSETSPALQYAGLALYVAVEAVIFLPLLMIASNKFEPAGMPHYQATLIPTAGLMTLMIAGGLTLSVFITRKDYSSLGPILSVAGFAALGFVIAAAIFGFTLGVFFSFAMVGLMSGYILYETSAIMLHFRTDQHVAAALMLFASIATLFFYIVRILMAFNSRD